MFLSFLFSGSFLSRSPLSFSGIPLRDEGTRESCGIDLGTVGNETWNEPANSRIKETLKEGFI